MVLVIVVVVAVAVVVVVVVVLCPTLCMSFCFACMCMLSTQQRLNNNKQLPINNAIVKQCFVGGSVSNNPHLHLHKESHRRIII